MTCTFLNRVCEYTLFRMARQAACNTLLGVLQWLKHPTCHNAATLHTHAIRLHDLCTVAGVRSAPGDQCTTLHTSAHSMTANSVQQSSCRTQCASVACLHVCAHAPCRAPQQSQEKRPRRSLGARLLAKLLEFNIGGLIALQQKPGRLGTLAPAHGQQQPHQAA